MGVDLDAKPDINITPAEEADEVDEEKKGDFETESLFDEQDEEDSTDPTKPVIRDEL